MAKAGLADGFTVTMDVRNGQPVTGIAESFQQTLGQAGVKLEIIPGDGKQTLTKYRARNHDMYIGQWGMDYFDPNSNAETFTSNPDNSDEGKNKTLAWRNAWDVPELTKKTKDALLERDSAKRAETYKELQKTVLGESPFVIIFQQTEVAGYRGNVKGLKLGPSFDTNFVCWHLEGITRKDSSLEHERNRTDGRAPTRPSGEDHGRRVALPRDRRHHLSRPSGRDLLHRPGDPDRPGARRPRRPGADACRRTDARGDGAATCRSTNNSSSMCARR